MITVEIPIKDARKPPKLKFSERCVHCGKPNTKTLPVRLNTGGQKRGQMVQVEMDVPFCAECVQRENKIGNITWIPFVAAGLLTFILVAIPVWRILPEGPTLQTAEFPYVLAAFVGMIAGLLVGTLVEFLLKMLFVPVYGKLLLQRPLTVFSILNDSEDLIGLSTRFANERKTLKLNFENDELAREFIALNPQET